MNNNRSSRHENKEKKVNRLYNLLIAVVAVLIVFVGGTMILGNKDKSDNQAETNQTNPQTNDQKTDKTAKKEDDSSKDDQATDDQSSEEDQSSEDDQSTSEDDQATDEESNDSDSQAEVEKNPEPGVAERKVDPSWDSVGTSQDAPAATYKKGSTDWNEMLKAVGEGSGISPSNMTVWRLGNNGGVGKAVATISPKGNSSTKYRVQIEWVDGEGWKPAVVDKLQ
ncbi:DUF1510 family protein [Priestia aryabhattai]|uniref:YrrS family protein n=1 Tax=Priestia TaxID=2800373 RepID=UPI00203A8CFA|nr:DUF1510 family protein [Priestia aryabhattai]MCM3769853.1 DUF1510 family protein [Priestia aryabhattai]